MPALMVATPPRKVLGPSAGVPTPALTAPLSCDQSVVDELCASDEVIDTLKQSRSRVFGSLQTVRQIADASVERLRTVVQVSGTGPELLGSGIELVGTVGELPCSRRRLVVESSTQLAAPSCSFRMPTTRSLAPSRSLSTFASISVAPAVSSFPVSAPSS